METGLLQLGVAGVMLTWFMWRIEARLDRGERSIDRLTRSLLLDLVSRSDTTETLKLQARAILGEMPTKTVAEQLIVGVGR